MTPKQLRLLLRLFFVVKVAIFGKIRYTGPERNEKGM